MKQNVNHMITFMMVLVISNITSAQEQQQPYKCEIEYVQTKVLLDQETFEEAEWRRYTLQYPILETEVNLDFEDEESCIEYATAKLNSTYGNVLFSKAYLKFYKLSEVGRGKNRQFKYLWIGAEEIYSDDFYIETKHINRRHAIIEKREVDFPDYACVLTNAQGDKYLEDANMFHQEALDTQRMWQTQIDKRQEKQNSNDCMAWAQNFANEKDISIQYEVLNRGKSSYYRLIEEEDFKKNGQLKKAYNYYEDKLHLYRGVVNPK